MIIVPCFNSQSALMTFMLSRSVSLIVVVLVIKRAENLISDEHEIPQSEERKGTSNGHKI